MRLGRSGAGLSFRDRDDVGEVVGGVGGAGDVDGGGGGGGGYEEVEKVEESGVSVSLFGSDDRPVS